MPRPVKRPVSESGELADLVSLICAPGEAPDKERSMLTGRKADTWGMVHRHWRQQWYLSQGERLPRWIEPHEAGADDGEMLRRDRVRVPRSR